jgi:hypothetical protein
MVWMYTTVRMYSRKGWLMSWRMSYLDGEHGYVDG